MKSYLMETHHGGLEEVKENNSKRLMSRLLTVSEQGVMLRFTGST